MERRKFLKTSGSVVGTVVGFSTAVSAQAEERKSTADPNKKIKDHLRNGEVEKAKKFLEAHDRVYVHQDGGNTATKTLETGKTEVAAANTQGILGRV